MDGRVRYRGGSARDGRDADYVACVRLLLERGADIDKVLPDGRTALFTACMDGRESCARLLIEKGADASKETTHGDTALKIARRRGHAAICALLEA